MKIDTKTLDTPSMLRDAYEQVSWTPDTMLRVLSDYLDEHGDLEHLAYYLSERVRDESAVPLYDLPEAPRHEKFMPPDGMKVMEVEVMTAAKDLHELDGGVAGVYRIAVPVDVEDSTSAGIVLDVFHESIPVKCLDDFVFKVTGDHGQEIQQSDNYEASSGSSKGFLIRKK